MKNEIKKSRPYLANNGLNENRHIVGCRKVKTENVPLHWHNFFELELIVEGEGQELINGELCQMTRGCGSLFSPSDYHSITPTNSMKFLSLSFDEHFLSDEQLRSIVMGKSLSYFKMNNESFDVVRRLCELCIDEASSDRRDEVFLKKLVECLISKMVSSVSQREGRYASHNYPISQLHSGILYMHTRFCEQITLSDVARIAHYNTSYFSSEFHKALGMTFKEYLTKLRIDYAKRLLLSTDLDISKICYKSGFSSASTFLQTFKRSVGVAPTKFRAGEKV